MVSKLISFRACVSLRIVSSRFETAISSSPPLGASRSSQARKRDTAAPSRLCAERAPLISAPFLRALGSRHGSGPRTMRALPPLSLRKNQLEAVAGSSRTRLPRPLSAFSRRSRFAGSLILASAARCALASGPILAGSTNSSGLPLAGTIANASATGLCATSAPRMLSNQATESGSVRITASSPSLRNVACSSAIFCSAALPAYFKGCGITAPCGAAGRSRPQIRSTGLAPSGLSLMPLGFSALTRSSIAAAVCSLGSKPTTPPAFRCLASHSSSLACGICRTSKVRVSTCAGACTTYRPSTKRAAAARPTTASPAEPEKPVSHLSRSAERGTYSPWCSSARGTSTASSPAFAIRRRSFSTRSAPLWRVSGGS